MAGELITKDDDYCSQNRDRCGNCSLVNYGKDCHNHPVHLHTCGHRATVDEWFIDIFGEPNYTTMETMACYDCRQKR